MTAPGEGRSLPDSPEQRELLDRFAEAFEEGRVDRIVSLLTEDAWLRMPPAPHEYQGREAAAGFLSSGPIWKDGRRVRVVATRANSRPAFAYYLPEPDGKPMRPHGLLVLTLDENGINDITRVSVERTWALFGLPETLPAIADG